MRNLKKILALVLAFLMSLSLMATAGATDFKDDSDVSDTYRHAVEVLSELGVFNGDQNGQFNPGQPITRAEVAAILYRIGTGDTSLEGYKTYAPYNQFKDINVEDWYAGYVTYCGNAGWIKGRSDGTFDAKANVTGYEVLAMILRAVGYDKNNEFTSINGQNWQLNTASLAREKGVLVNVIEDPSVQLSDPATRQVVAELLFRASLLPQVTYNTATLSYSESGETLAKQNLGLEEITGVVMANEYADLEGDTPIDANTTRLSVDGKAYTLDIGSELNDIGELRHAFVLNGTHVLGELEDQGDSNVAEAANDGGEGSKVSDVAKKAGLTLSETTTEYFVNFGEDWDFDSEWYLEYSVTFDTTKTGNNEGANLFASEYIDVYRVKWEDGDSTIGNVEQNPKNLDKDLIYTYNSSTKEATFTKIIRAGTKITSADLKIMEGIFKAADATETPIDGTGHSNGITGYVYGGGTNNASSSGSNANRNLAITMTWSQFYSEYINSGDLSYRESDNGEWLKIIDNDGDNVADYVLRTDFVMTTIDRFNTNNDTYTVEYRVDGSSVEIPVGSVSDKGHLNVGDVQVMETVAADELSVRDVIMYTLIDGVYHISYPEKVTVTVDKVDKTNLTFTCGDEVYNWSGIDERAVNYHDEAVDGVAGVNYNLYLDQFGYIRLYTEAEKGFALLLNAFYDTDERSNFTWKVEAWDVEAGESVDWTLTDNYYGYVDERSGGNSNDTMDNRGTWTRLAEFGQIRYQPYYYNDANETWVPTLAAPYYGRYVSVDDTLVKSGYQPDPFWTNVAAYTGGSDGLYTLTDPEGMAANTTTYHTYQVDAGSWAVNSQNMDGIKSWTSAGAIDKTTRIRATSSTVYYYVTGKTGVVDVASWDGLGNFSGSASSYIASRVYAVTAEVPGIDKNDANYYELAQVIVIEGILKADSTASKTGNFALWAPIDKDYPAATYVIPRSRAADNSSNYDPRYIYALGPVGDGFETGKSLRLDTDSDDYGEGGLLNFYGIDDYGYAYLIENNYDDGSHHPNGSNVVKTKNYADHNIAAGYIVSWDGLTHEFDLNKGKSPVGSASEVEEELSYDVKTWIVVPYGQSNTFGGYDLKLCSSSQHNDKVIYMYDIDGKVAAVINVTRSIVENPGNEAIKMSLEGLWTDICDEIENYEAGSTLSVTFYGVEDGKTGDTDGQANGSITVAYSTAKAFVEKYPTTNPVQIKGANQVWADSKTVSPSKDADVTYTYQIQATSGSAPVVWTFTQSKGNSVKTLTNDTHNPDCSIDLGSAGSYLPLVDWVKKYQPTEAAAGATVEYQVTTTGNTLITVNYADGEFIFEDAGDKSFSMEFVKSVNIVVTAEDGTSESHYKLADGAVDYLAQYNTEVARVTTGVLFGDTNGTKNQVINLPGVWDEVTRAAKEIQDAMAAGTGDDDLATLYTTNVGKLRAAIIKGMKEDAAALYEKTWANGATNPYNAKETMRVFWDLLDYNKTPGENYEADTKDLCSFWNNFAYEMWKNQWKVGSDENTVAVNTYINQYVDNGGASSSEAANTVLAGWNSTIANFFDGDAKEAAAEAGTRNNPYVTEE